MIERIQGWLVQVSGWLAAAPMGYVVAAVAMVVVVLLAALAATRRARQKATATRATARTVAARATTAPAATVAPAEPAPATPGAEHSPAAARPIPAARAGEDAARLVVTSRPLYVSTEAEAAIPESVAAGGVAVAERPTSAPPEVEAADRAYRQASALLAQAGADGKTLREAVTLLRRAQEVWTREADPERWAALQNEIGCAYQEMPNGDRAANLSAAIAHHESALEVFDPVRHALSWAWTQSALAAAYQCLPTGSSISNARAAVAYHQRALDVLTPESAPLGWAWNQNNLGAAYELMRGAADGDRVRALQDASACYKEALRVYTASRFPVQHQIVTQNLLRVEDELRAIE